MSEQKSRRQRRVFSASFKADAVKVVRAQERPVKEIAKDLTIDEGLLRRWLRQADNPILSQLLRSLGDGSPTRLGPSAAVLPRQNARNFPRFGRR